MLTASSQNFNPLPHAEGDNVPAKHVHTVIINFNPLPHAEGDRVLYTWCSDAYRISIHSLTQRETETGKVLQQHLEFQTTPSRRGRPRHENYWIISRPISIHSLTQRETAKLTKGHIHIHKYYQLLQKFSNKNLKSKIILTLKQIYIPIITCESIVFFTWAWYSQN